MIQEQWQWAPCDRGYRDPDTGIWEDLPMPASVYAGGPDDEPDKSNMIAYMNSRHDEKRQEMNARLIAALPKLLEACKAMLATWGTDDEDAIIASRDLAREAITDAEPPRGRRHT